MSLYGGETPVLELRIRRMYTTPPWRQTDKRREFLQRLKATGVDLPDLDAGAYIRPNIPLGSFAPQGRVSSLLSILDDWIDEVLRHTGEREEDEECDADGSEADS
jgi:hypothetical protein